MRRKKKNNKLISILIYAGVIICTCCLSIGYASIGTTTLDIKTTVSANISKGVFISNVEYLSNVNADMVNSKIIDYTQSVLHSNIFLSTSDASSSITYTMRILNNSGAEKAFTGVTYSDGFYSNPGITYSLSGLEVNDIIGIGESKTFNITFSYLNFTGNNQLDSYLSFNFDDPVDDSDVDIFITEGESYTYAGVSQSNPIDITNIANVKFVVKNSNSASLSSVDVDIVYISSTGNTNNTAVINLYDSNGAVIQSQTVQFSSKQTNRTATTTFSGLNIKTNEKLSVGFSNPQTGNNKITLSGFSIRPSF